MSQSNTTPPPTHQLPWDANQSSLGTGNSSFHTLEGHWVFPESSASALLNKHYLAPIGQELEAGYVIEKRQKTRFERYPVQAPSENSASDAWELVYYHQEQLVALHSHISQLQAFILSLGLYNEEELTYDQYCRKKVKLMALFQDARRH